MKYLRNSIFILAVAILLLCCVSNKNMETCEIKKVLRVITEDNNSYYMQVKFTHCTSKESREALIKDEIKKRFPLIVNRTIHVDEYLGKMYNEYKYEIKVE